MDLASTLLLLFAAPIAPSDHQPSQQSGQQPGQSPSADAAAAARVQDERKALAKRVTKAHRGENKDVIDRYAAEITLRPMDKKESNIEVGLKVQYGAKIVRAKGAEPVEMIRYAVNEGDEPIERGKDPRPWQRVGKRVTSLMSRDDPNARRLLDRDTRLCKQMLSFLDPGAILRGLRGNEPIQDTELKLGRKLGTFQAELIRGRLGSFPIFRSDTKTAEMRAVFLEAWIDKKTSRLIAIQVFPIDLKGKPITSRGEFIALSGYVRSTASKGVLIPQEIYIYESSAGKRTVRALVKLLKFELNANLTKADFKRPK